MNGSDWTARCPLIVQEAKRLDGFIIDAEVVCADANGVPDFDALHSRTNDHLAVACAFDLLMLNGDDLRRKPFADRKVALRKVLRRSREGIQYVEHTEDDGEEMFQATCKLGLEGIVSKRIDASYRSGPARSWLKIRNPNAPAATRVADGTF
jgi:bifunctional non-homologous end joining protein LigD